MLAMLGLLFIEDSASKILMHLGLLCLRDKWGACPGISCCVLIGFLGCFASVLAPDLEALWFGPRE